MCNEKNVIEKKAWSYSLEKCSAGYLFSVVCGTVGIYEVTVMLSPGQVALYEKNGADFLDGLAADVRKNSNR